ncbi:alpha/beta hydrolase family protein [Roseateles sp. NT4]|uniref:alpha/beta hydrolase family protein n=1 Tax=Roseateles sp. NT4 TaxID=3453715 RepID=UPI003EF069DC
MSIRLRPGFSARSHEIHCTGRRHAGPVVVCHCQRPGAQAADRGVLQAAGLADGKRICIAGASYGGYATLMGLVRDPYLFRCGFEWVGVTDPVDLFSRNRTDIESVWEYDLKLLVGDPEKDAEMFAANAPVKLAAKIKQPLLMAYGAQDRRVAAQQGTDMKKALEAAGYTGLEWVVYPTEGHGWRALETNKNFWGRVERFLERQHRQRTRRQALKPDRGGRGAAHEKSPGAARLPGLWSFWGAISRDGGAKRGSR